MQTKKLSCALGVFVFVLIFRTSPVWGTVVQITAPPNTTISGENIQIVPLKEGTYNMILPSSPVFPLTLTFQGPLGGIVKKEIFSPSQLWNFSVKAGIIRGNAANPPVLALLPALCPRLKKTSSSYIYDASKDKLNHAPGLALFDPDANEENQRRGYRDMDGKNVLLLKHVSLRYDYEDTAIVDYAEKNPLTGKTETVNEGEGGFYASFHYAIVPHDPAILKWDRQILLHMANGKLQDIDREDLRPPLRTHSLIPGPFLSRKKNFYEMCEWGDTAYQAPHQELGYEDMALWDWDYSVKNADHVLMIVWEGDEESRLLNAPVLSPFYLTDDVVGIFEIRRKQTLKPLKLKNKKGDFEMTVETGNLKTPPF